MRRRGGKKTIPHGANPRTFPLSVREYVEIDYIHKLSDAEVEWLAKFNDEYHGATYLPTDHDKGCACEDCEDRRAAYRRKNAANNDVYAISRTTGLAVSSLVVYGKERDASEFLSADLDADQSAEPVYLDSKEYRRALEKLRELLPTNRKNKVVDSPRLRAAFKRLERAGGKKGTSSGEESD